MTGITGGEKITFSICDDGSTVAETTVGCSFTGSGAEYYRRSLVEREKDPIYTH